MVGRKDGLGTMSFLISGLIHILSHVEGRLAMFAATTGVLTNITGLLSNSVWATMGGAALGFGGVAWVVGMMVRDRAMEFQKKQTEEMAVALKDVSDKKLAVSNELATITSQYYNLKMHLNSQDEKSDKVSSEMKETQKQISSDHTDLKNLVELLQERLTRVVELRDKLIIRNEYLFNQNNKLHEDMTALHIKVEKLYESRLGGAPVVQQESEPAESG